MQVLVAESYGGDDEPVDSLMASLTGVGVEVLGDALRVKDTPTHQLYQAFEEAGTDLAQVIMAVFYQLRELQEGLCSRMSRYHHAVVSQNIVLQIGHGSVSRVGLQHDMYMKVGEFIAW